MELEILNRTIIQDTFTYKNYSLEYLKIGNGSKIILYFHGYGKNAKEFFDYETGGLTNFTVYSINFFHHGNSTYPADKVHSNTLSKAEWKEIMEAFFVANKIHTFGLMGYSMGGKICLNILAAFPGRTNFIILNAPDGIKRNFWYHFTSRNRLGTSLYKKIIDKPGFFLKTVNVMGKVGIISKKLSGFVIHHLETKEKREQVYRVWMTLRNMEPDYQKVVELINHYGIRTCLNYGQYDSVITPKPGRRFHLKTYAHSEFNLLEKGHNLVYNETGKKVSLFLKSL